MKPHNRMTLNFDIILYEKKWVFIFDYRWKIQNA